jgi:hypothetical protein
MSVPVTVTADPSIMLDCTTDAANPPPARDGPMATVLG